MRATQAGTIGELRGRNNLNALSRRSSSDLVSLSPLPAFQFGL
jgi:hypothetical protein